jgi:hypothetical protein
MAEAGNHSIRFKRGAVELEMTSTPEQIAAVWTSLEDSVVGAFSSTGDVDDLENDGQDEQTGNGDPTKRRTPRRRSPRKRTTASSGAGGREDVVSKLAEASMASYPKVGPRPSALMAGYATLSWAHTELKIDGLTAAEIATLNKDRRRFSRTPQAFGQALGRRVGEGEVDVQGNPHVFRLMGHGEKALQQHIAEQAKSPKS